MTIQTSKVKLKKHLKPVNTKVLNPGDFLSLVKLAVVLDCPVLKEHFSNCPKNTMCTLKTIQNELVDMCAKQVVGKCITEINDSGKFSITVDAAVDISNVEQMSIVIKYVHMSNSKNVKVHCLYMVECREEVSGDNISSTILSSVKHKLHLGMNSCKDQGYDGTGKNFVEFFLTSLISTKK